MELSSYGLTQKLINNWQPPPFPPEDFYEPHMETLIYLIREQCIVPEVAIQEINGLNWAQASTLKKFYSGGLRGSHLREWITSTPTTSRGDVLFFEIGEALRYYTNHQKMSVKEAIQEIKGADLNQRRELFSNFTIN